MGTANSTLRAQSGVIPAALVGLAGFAAGALTVGLLAFTGRPASGGDVAHIPALTAGAQNGARDASMREATPLQTPARARPDGLAGPDDPTYDPAAPVDCSLAFTDPSCRTAGEGKK